MKNNVLLRSYIVFSVFYLCLILIGKVDIAWFLKPLPLPFLLISVYNFEKFPTKSWLFSALVFSWIGDIILMFAFKGELYFILGLISFLISHLLYIILFVKQGNTTRHRKNIIFWIAFILILLYLKNMLGFLYPKLGDLKIPVTIYALTISTMLLMALKGYFSWKKPENITILFGAIFFVMSDSILAINKFYEPLPYANFMIMMTYLIAQFAIVVGIENLNRKGISKLQK
ncbi:lysoplasmalogenase [Flavobacterium sp. GT3R68]|uniref:lysoplasmalogenase n=1 Tax=Flavobacterium sp. GT3R68 TaxID=2594437 RepID=UPI000F880D33|nr:lysoplasmalogenase [Flavobacterium sp. GT3R68]RTY89110.1 lysoplasmalogenase [Flavobacterium sp. GSN2]TRW90092.1 lysoplasmalogenase [Flavobacterium sp. GT3R68]